MLLAGAAVFPSRVVRAQQTERMRRVGYLTPVTGSADDLLGVRQTRALVAGLRELGWFDGRNITIEHRFSGSGRNRTRNNAKELVSLNPDVIVSVGGPSLAALLTETQTRPQEKNGSAAVKRECQRRLATLVPKNDRAEQDKTSHGRD